VTDKTAAVELAQIGDSLHPAGILVNTSADIARLARIYERHRRGPWDLWGATGLSIREIGNGAEPMAWVTWRLA
jgi:hypothetical protein